MNFFPLGMDILEISPGVFLMLEGERRLLATVNMVTGRSVYGEQLIRVGALEYRVWNPFRSKLAAALLKGLKTIPIVPGVKVLYLGVASGTTCSHISDIVGRGGHIWGVDFAPRPLRDLLENLAPYRENVSPILGDARRPEDYSAMVPKVDVIYADVAQPDQSSIVLKNSELILKPSGWVVMAIKSRSIDVTRPPEEVYKEEVERLEVGGLKVLELVDLEPFERDHSIAVARCLR